MHDSWKVKLEPLRELAKIPHYAVVHAQAAGDIIYPPAKDRFNAFNMPFESVKVVIIGQDPYHGKGQANGLAFSVNRGVTVPPSLVNIYKELKDDVGCETPDHGDLSSWVDQGVLLLNTSLTVKAGNPASHKDIGWLPFIGEVISILNNDIENLVFILWGKHAQSFADGLSPNHYIIKSAHPSPFSADRGFFGSRPFSECNAFLRTNGKSAINWEIK